MEENKNYVQEFEQMNENLLQLTAELSKIGNNTTEMKGDIQLILGYIAQIRFASQELVKNTAFANALSFLHDQTLLGDNAIMDMKEIQTYYKSIRDEIFIEYNEEYKARLAAQAQEEEQLKKENEDG